MVAIPPLVLLSNNMRLEPYPLDCGKKEPEGLNVDCTEPSRAKGGRCIAGTLNPSGFPFDCRKDVLAAGSVGESGVWR